MNGGIIDKSKNAVDKYSQEEVQEQIKLAYSEWQMGQYTGVTDTAAKFIQDKLNEIYGPGTVTNVTEESAGTFKIEFTGGKVKYYSVGTGKVVESLVELLPTAAIDDKPVQENSKYTVDGKTAVIPAGYKISTNPNEQSIDNGLVIKKGNNEWVWIPVANVTDLYIENTTEIPWTMYETSGENAVVSRYASKSEILSGKTRTTPGTISSYREPDTVCKRPSYMGGVTDYDAVQENRTAAGFTTLEDMATKLRDDYKAMIDSVKKNGGFYVGRYELSSAGTKKQEAPLTDTNWYNLYKACKDIDSTGVETRMIWGCQWDQVCNFIKTYKEGTETKTRDITNSTSYGNYSNSTVSGHGSKQVTGYSDSWKTNNIYDLAGNCYEWTQEACDASYRANRGGDYNFNGGNGPVTSRDYDYPANTSGNSSSRPVLYIK